MKGVFKEGTKYFLWIIKPYKNELSAVGLEFLCNENGTECGDLRSQTNLLKTIWRFINESIQEIWLMVLKIHNRITVILYSLAYSRHTRYLEKLV